MNICSVKLTVFFDEPFWVGVFERKHEDGYEVCRVVFGAEPKDYDINLFVLQNYYGLKFSRSFEGDCDETKRINPKRTQRLVQQELNKRGISTKAQEALKKEFEESKKEHRADSKLRRETAERYKFEKKQQKKKEKKKGH